MHEINLITTIAFGLTAALIFGLLAKRIGLSPIVGYLIAGIAIGPHTPGFVGDVALAKQLAEIGVILLMFGVGLHFHLDDLMKVRLIAIPGALGQSAVATGCALAVAVVLGWSIAAGTVLGIAVSVASTEITVLTRSRHMKSGGALEDAGASAIVYDEAAAATALAVVLRAHLKATGATAKKAGAT